jgi:uncharacterized protein with PhoU and TrkA domain
MGIFEVGMVGLPVALAGLLYLVVVGPKYLPNRLGLTDVLERPREYVTGMFVKKASELPNEPSLEGKTILEAGLRNLAGLYLVRIERENGDVLSAPEPQTMLQGGDKLVFAGVVNSVLSLTSIRGLRLGGNAEDEINLYRLKGEDILVEAVVAPRSAMVHRTVRELKFRWARALTTRACEWRVLHVTVGGFGPVCACVCLQYTVPRRNCGRAPPWRTGVREDWQHSAASWRHAAVGDQTRLYDGAQEPGAFRAC